MSITKILLLYYAGFIAGFLPYAMDSLNIPHGISRLVFCIITWTVVFIMLLIAIKYKGEAK